MKVITGIDRPIPDDLLPDVFGTADRPALFQQLEEKDYA